MKILLNDVSANRDKWLALRANTIGSSEIAAVAGVSRYVSPLKLWGIKTGRIPPVEENAHMRLGSLLEPFIGSEYGRQKNKQVVPANVLVAADDCEAFTASPDFWEIDSSGAPVGIIETKNVNFRSAPDWEEGGCPDEYMIQLQWQLAITGVLSGSVVAMLGGSPNEIEERPCVFDSELAYKLFERAHSFLEMVRSDTPPAPNHADRKDIEAGMNPGSEQVTRRVVEDCYLPLFDDYFAALSSRRVAEGEIKLTKKHEESLRAQIESLAGNAEFVFCGPYKVKLNRVNKRGFYVEPTSYITCALYREDLKV